MNHPVPTLEPAQSVGSAPAMERRQFLQLTWITLAAIAIYIGLRLLPTGTNLNHGDFRVEGVNALEFCDPAKPQFIPVIEAKSPVSMTVRVTEPPAAGRETLGVLTLKTSSGKPVGPQDLLVVHTRPLHLMAIDPTLGDYQHLHPEPGAQRGEWLFAFTPKAGGAYRLFADFTPIATGRGLYASVDLPVDAGSARGALGAAEHPPFRSGVEVDGYRFELVTSVAPVRADQIVDYKLTITATEGGGVPLQPVMGAYAHLVAFDARRTGFAHLHPAQADPLAAPDSVRPELPFKLSIPQPGRYVIWSQVSVAGRETFVPFWIDVAAEE